MNLAPVFGLVVFALFCHSGVQAEVTKCYSCEGKCDSPKEQNCEEFYGVKTDYVCATATDGAGNEYRTCMASAALQTYCNVYKATGGTCDSCDSDLCNGAEHYSASVVVASVLVFIVAKFI